MPELPDVEAFRRYLADHAVGQRIERVEALDDDVVRNTSPQGLGRALKGRRFAKPDRHGKWILAHTDGRPVVVLHFGMTGYLTWAPRGSDRHDHDRVVFVCDDGELRFNLMRKFGGVWLARGPDEIRTVTGPLGPDATAVSQDYLGELLDGRRATIKSALMDQELMAGVGNIVADEVLWHARVNPRRRAADVTGEDLGRLTDALDEVLDRSIDHGQVPRDADWLTHARDVDDAACPRCGTPVEKDRINNRATYWCPTCQPAP